ncbi:3'-5' exonuclease DinG [subsurface metagenome]
MSSTLEKLFESKKTSISSLREWQKKFSDYWLKFNNAKIFGLSTATGSGKTIAGLLILEQGRQKGQSGVYLTHTRQLMNRIAEEADKLDIKYFILGGATGITGIQYDIRIQNIYKYNHLEHIIISNYDAFLKTKDFPENIDILVIDDIDLFYEKLREFFSIKIKNYGGTKIVYEQIIESLSKRNYQIISKIKEGSIKFDDGNELSIEPYIFPINEIKRPTSNNKRFENIKKIIILSATLGCEERFTLELGLVRDKLKLISDEDFEKEGISTKMGERLIFPISELQLNEVNPLYSDFVNVSFKYIKNLILEFRKILILCWKINEKQEIIRKLKNDLKDVKIFDFTGRNYNVINEFFNESNTSKSCLIIANRYFGLDIPSQSCKVCLITRLPTFLDNFDIMLDKFVMDQYYYYELQMRRIKQSVGRINRGENDFTAYFILDPRFTKAVSQLSSFYPLLEQDLRARIDFSFKKSRYGDFKEALDIAKHFIENNNTVRKDLEEYIEKEPIAKDSRHKLIAKLLKTSDQEEITGWRTLYENRYDKAIEHFENLIDALSSDQNVPEFKRKIEWYNYIIYLLYFKREKKGGEDFSEKLKEYEDKIKNSEELTWLNEISLYATKDVKIQALRKKESPTLTQKRFQEYAKDPKTYLGNIYGLEEIKPTFKNIAECLENLSQKQVSSPIRTLAVEFDKICQRVLERRIPSIYKVLKEEGDLVISNILTVLMSNNFLRKSVYKKLDEGPRSLRNTIIHVNEEAENIEYPEAIRYCQDLREGIECLLKEVYTSDMLRQAKDILPEFRKIPKYKYLSERDLESKILKLWHKEKIKFEPLIDVRKEISTYSGKIKITVEGKLYELKFNSEL